jgi:NAD(P)-dependent dehydrogenase (short-subunit alcohol dehydrogenase family)
LAPAADFASRDGVALVSGGSGAIGAAVCRLLAERGSAIAFTYLRRAESAQELAAELRGLGATVECSALDLTDADATASLVAAVAERFGGIHTLVYASGPFVPLRYLSRVPPREFADQLGRDAVACYNLLHPSVEHLRHSRGNVVAVGTTAVTRAITRDGLSAGPKGAVTGVIRTLALEEGRYGVRANVVGVGVTSVGIAAQLRASGEFDEAGVAAATAAIPLGRFGNAEEIAEAVCFLASDRAAFITGQILNVDGGYSA